MWGSLLKPCAALCFGWVVVLPSVSESVFIFFCTADKLSRRQCPPIACIRFTHALIWSILGHFGNVSEPASSFSNRLGLYSQSNFRSFSAPPSIMVRLSWYWWRRSKSRLSAMGWSRNLKEISRRRMGIWVFRSKDAGIYSQGSPENFIRGRQRSEDIESSNTRAPSFMQYKAGYWY